MKKLSIIMLALTTVHAIATSGDVTALTAAFMLFSYACGKDILRIWGNMVQEKGDAFTSPRKEDCSN